eukprot:982810-Amphidinium_carterae.1
MRFQPSDSGSVSPKKGRSWVGTWRVSREMYIHELGRLNVKVLADVRGNPKSGRQDIRGLN